MKNIASTRGAASLGLKSLTTLTVALTMTAAVSLSGCAGVTAMAHRAGASSSSAGHSSNPVASSSSAYQLVQFPASTSPGARAASLIDAATTSVWLQMYSLNDPENTEAALIAAHRRGVDVRVLLDAAFGGTKFNMGAYHRLTRAGVSVRWAPAHTIFHIKTLVIDNNRGLILTANLNKNDYNDTIDAGIITSNQQQVHAITATFTGDWAGRKPAVNTTNAPGLLWSPGGAPAMLALIASARNSVDYSSEELAYAPIVDALVTAAHHGIACRVLVPYEKNFADQINTLRDAGCAVTAVKKTQHSLYPHIKQIIIDNNSALLGSQNDSYTSLFRNRELSILVTKNQNPATVNALTATFMHDMTLQ